MGGHRTYYCMYRQGSKKAACKALGVPEEGEMTLSSADYMKMQMVEQKIKETAGKLIEFRAKNAQLEKDNKELKETMTKLQNELSALEKVHAEELAKRDAALEAATSKQEEALKELEEKEAKLRTELASQCAVEASKHQQAPSDESDLRESLDE